MIKGLALWNPQKRCAACRHALQRHRDGEMFGIVCDGARGTCPCKAFTYYARTQYRVMGHARPAPFTLDDEPEDES